MSETRRLGDDAGRRNSKSADELLPMAYDELRQLAAARMAQLPPGQTLDPTALVHEAWLRVSAGQRQEWDGRTHFFAAAAQAMRHILIERARRKLRARHGGRMERVDLDPIEIAAPEDDDRLLQLNDALDRLAEVAPDKAEVVKLRFFAGLNEQQIAELLQISPRTVERHWSYAKAWLYEQIDRNAEKKS